MQLLYTDPISSRLPHYCVTFAENETISEITEVKRGKIKVMGKGSCFYGKA